MLKPFFRYGAAALVVRFELNRLPMQNVGHHGGRRVDYPLKKTPQAVLPCMPLFKKAAARRSLELNLLLVLILAYRVFC